MPYWAPSVKGAQCQGYSWLPLVRGAGWLAQPGISSLVRLGCKPELTSLNLTSCIAATLKIAGNMQKSLGSPKSSRGIRASFPDAVQRRARETKSRDERPGVQLVEGLLQLGLGVHDDRAVPRDRLADRLAGNEQEADAVVAGLHRHLVAGVEQNQRAITGLLACHDLGVAVGALSQHAERL